MNPDTINKYGYHKPKDASDAEKIAQSRRIFAEAAEKLTALLPPGREASVAHTHLETASFWANAAIARAWGPAEPFGA
jgi:hypothetical protein